MIEAIDLTKLMPAGLKAFPQAVNHGFNKPWMIKKHAEIIDLRSGRTDL